MCSSDLWVDVDVGSGELVELVISDPDGDSLLGASGLDKIGRASCRERV